MLDLDAVDAEVSDIAQLAESTRLPLASWHLLRQQASRAALAGQLTLARDRSWQACQLAIRLQDRSGQGISYAFATRLAVIRGDAAEIPADLFDVMQAAPRRLRSSAPRWPWRCSPPAGPRKRGRCMKSSAGCPQRATRTCRRSSCSST